MQEDDCRYFKWFDHEISFREKEVTLQLLGQKNLLEEKSLMLEEVQNTNEYLIKKLEAKLIKWKNINIDCIEESRTQLKLHEVQARNHKLVTKMTNLKAKDKLCMF